MTYKHLLGTYIYLWFRSIRYMEEISIIVLVSCVGVVSFVLGSWFSPKARVIKEETKYWRGLYGQVKKEIDAMYEVEESKEPITALVKQYPVLKPFQGIIKGIMENPQVLSEIFKIVKEKGTEAVKEIPEWG